MFRWCKAALVRIAEPFTETFPVYSPAVCKGFYIRLHPTRYHFCSYDVVYRCISRSLTQVIGDVSLANAYNTCESFFELLKQWTYELLDIIVVLDTIDNTLWDCDPRTQYRPTLISFNAFSESFRRS